MLKPQIEDVDGVDVAADATPAIFISFGAMDMFTRELGK